MITLPKAFLGVLATVLVLTVACDSESTPIAGEDTTPAAAQQSECPGCVLRSRIASAQPGDTINIAARLESLAPAGQRRDGGEHLVERDAQPAADGERREQVLDVVRAEQRRGDLFAVHTKRGAARVEHDVRGGEIALVFNSNGMFRGAADSTGRFEVKIWE